MLQWSQFTAVDWVVLTVLGVSILVSLWRGFTREAMSLASWVAAFLVANLYVERMSLLLADAIDNITGRYVASYATLFVLTLMVGGLLAILVSKLVHITGLSLLDRLLGTVFGFARGVILILVCVFVLRQLVAPRDLQWLQDSRLMPHLDMLAQWVQDIFSQYRAGGWSGTTP